MPFTPWGFFIYFSSFDETLSLDQHSRLANSALYDLETLSPDLIALFNQFPRIEVSTEDIFQGHQALVEIEIFKDGQWKEYPEVLLNEISNWN